MKKIILLTIVLFTCLNTTVEAKKNFDGKDKKDTLTIEMEIEDMVKVLQEQLKLLQMAESINGNLDSLYSKGNYNYFYNSDKNTKFETFSLTCIGVFIAVFILVFYFVKIQLKGYDLKKALSEIKLLESLSTNAAGVQTKSNTEIMIESSSRLLAFLSGVVALALSLMIILVSIYTFLNTGIIPDFSQLVNSVLALGIGIIPYSVNRVASIFKSNNT